MADRPVAFGLGSEGGPTAAGRLAPAARPARRQNDTRSFPAEPRYWETVLPLCTFEGRELVAIELHPVTLGPGSNWPERGTPRLADPRHGEEILRWMAELSAAYGTVIDVAGGVGRVRL